MISKIPGRISIFAFVIGLLTFNPLSAQSYIEVTVQDTIMLKADYFLYSFLVNNYTNTTDTVSSDNTQGKRETGDERQRRNFTAIVNELKRNNFKLYAPTLIDSLSISPGGDGFIRSGTLLMYSLDSLKLANMILRKFDNVMAYVQSKKAVTPADEKRLYKKLVDMAKRQANSIAELSGRKVKQLISVTEKQLERGYNPYVSAEGPDIPGWHASIGTPAFASTSNEIYYPVGSTFTLRFSLQP